MNKSRRFTALIALPCLLALFTTSAFSDPELVFGPAVYYRTTEGPLVESVDFDVAEGVQDCVLQVYNGGFGSETKSDYVSTAWVGLNGQSVFDPDDFNKTVVFLEAPVSVELSNQLSVELGGSPDSRLEVRLRCDSVVIPPPGVLLEGDPDSPAAEAFFDLAPQAAPSDEIVDGVILSRLDTWFDTDATVGEVNAALTTVGGRIVSMVEGITAATVAVPPQANVDDLHALAEQLKAHSAVLFAFAGRTAMPKELPPGFDIDDDFDELLFLLSTRFPAAWNARARAENICVGVQVMVVDHFNGVEPEGFSEQVPGFTLFDPDTNISGATHGYEVAGVLAALFDTTVPFGANPVPHCLGITGVDVENITEFQRLVRVSNLFQSDPFVLNMSLGFEDKVRCRSPQGRLIDCPAGTEPDPSEYTRQLDPAIKRAVHGLFWKLLTEHRWQDFVAVTAAGNEADLSEAGFYEGLGQAAYSNEMAVAATSDPLFGFVQDANLWDPFPLPLPSLVATQSDVATLHFLVELLGMQNIVAENVITVGSVTGGIIFDATILELTESTDSDRNPDVKAVGQNVTVVGDLTRNGTSFASPQVAGLATYLMLLDPLITPAQVKQTILANAKNSTSTTDIIDAYATVLSLDAAALPTTAGAPVRHTILDVNGNGFFTLFDIEDYLARYTDPVTHEPIPDPSDKDWSRFDLNGDGFTGGSSVTPFDLDRVGSTQYGMELITTGVTQSIEGVTVPFDETQVTDLQVLCYYAYSQLLDDFDPSRRKELLGEVCLLQCPEGSSTFTTVQTSAADTCEEPPPPVDDVSGTYVGTGLDYDWGEFFSETPTDIVITQEGNQLTITFFNNGWIGEGIYNAVLTGSTFSGSTDDCRFGSPPCDISGSFEGNTVSGTAFVQNNCPGGCYTDFTATRQ
jgi:hypothetical protein